MNYKLTIFGNNVYKEIELSESEKTEQEEEKKQEKALSSYLVN